MRRTNSQLDTMTHATLASPKHQRHTLPGGIVGGRTRSSSQSSAVRLLLRRWWMQHHRTALALLVLTGLLLVLYRYTATLTSDSTVPLSTMTHHPQAQVSAATGLRFHTTPYDPADIAHLRWGIIFDAGSTGSRVHIYRFRMTPKEVITSVGVATPSNELTPVLEDEIFVEVKPGLSAYVPSGVGAEASTRDVGQTSSEHNHALGPDAAAKSLQSLLDLCREQVPREAHLRTPIALRATAGLRLLGEATSASILASIRALFSAYPFPFDESRDVEVMAGSEEGVFAWITVNYLNAQLSDRAPSVPHDEHPVTSAILDLGGASTQIVFEPARAAVEALPADEAKRLYTLEYGANMYKLYETSYLGYGLMEARRRVKLNLLEYPHFQARLSGSTSDGALLHPCMSDTHSESIALSETNVHMLQPVRGYAQGYASCAALVRTLFPKHPAAPCLSSACSFGGHFALPLANHATLAELTSDKSRGRIYAFSYFYDRTLEIFELEEELEPYGSPVDGTILKLGRIRQLADTICAFSMRAHEVRSYAALDAEKKAVYERDLARARENGCRTVRVVHGATGKSREEVLLDDARAAPVPASPTSQPSEEKCTIYSTWDASHSQTEAAHAAISSPFVALLSENPYLCLDLTYAYTLLHHGYDLPDATELHVMKRLQKKEVGWCLGAMLKQMAQRGWQ